LKHELIRIAVIGDVSDASPISSGRTLLALRPLRSLWTLRSLWALRALRPLRSLWAFRTDKVHEQGPGPILLAKQVAAGRVQVDVAFFPQRSPRVRASVQKIHAAATSSTATRRRNRVARGDVDDFAISS